MIMVMIMIIMIMIIIITIEITMLCYMTKNDNIINIHYTLAILFPCTLMFSIYLKTFFFVI